MALMKVIAAGAGLENIIDVAVPLALSDDSTTISDVTLTGGGSIAIEVDTAFASAGALTAALADSLIPLVEAGINDPYSIPVLDEVLIPSTWDRKYMAAQSAFKIVDYTIS